MLELATTGGNIFMIFLTNYVTCTVGEREKQEKKMRELAHIHNLSTIDLKLL